MRFLLSALVVLTVCGPVVAQKGVGGGWAERLIVVVPLIGTGTFDDPVRPALALEQLGGSDGVGYRYEVSDDKRSAIVFLTSARVGRLRELPAKAQGLGVGLQVIEHERLGKAGAEVELKKLKKDLSLEKLAGLPVLPPSPSATAAKGALVLAILVFAAPVFGMTAYYSDTFTSWNGTNWQANGTIGVSGDRLTSADAAGGTAMSLPQPSGYFYEIFAQVRLLQSGGRYTILARASADARYGTVTTGSFYGVDFSNVVMNGASGTATMKIVKRVGGVLTQVAQLSVGVKDSMNVRVLVRPGGSQGFMFSVSIDERHTYYGEGDAALTSLLRLRLRRPSREAGAGGGERAGGEWL